MREREKQSASRGGAEREGDTVSEAGSRLWAVSTEPDTGLELTNCQIMTWDKVGRLTDWATQAPHKVFWFIFEGREQGRSRKRGGQKIWRGFCARTVSQMWPQTHKSWDHDLSHSRWLNWPSYPGALKVIFSVLNHRVRHPFSAKEPDIRETAEAGPKPLSSQEVCCGSPGANANACFITFETFWKFKRPTCHPFMWSFMTWFAGFCFFLNISQWPRVVENGYVGYSKKDSQTPNSQRLTTRLPEKKPIWYNSLQALFLAWRQAPYLKGEESEFCHNCKDPECGAYLVPTPASGGAVIQEGCSNQGSRQNPTNIFTIVFPLPLLWTYKLRQC